MSCSSLEFSKAFFLIAQGTFPCHDLADVRNYIFVCFFRFTPDFSMSRVTRKLEVRTALGRVMEFSLVATIPAQLLPLCSSALGRNSWEPVVQIVAVVLMVVLFLAIVIAAYAEARRLVFLSHPEVQLLHMKEEERGPVFDLNAIAGVKKHK